MTTQEILRRAKEAAAQFAGVTGEEKDRALHFMAVRRHSSTT